jgi:signal transduction histidine kinase
MERVGQSKLGAARLWRNPPVRRLAWLLAAVGIAGIAFVWIYKVQSAERLRKDWLDEQTAIIGQLAKSDPQKAKEWAALLAHPSTSEQTEAGRKIAEQYGLTPALGSRLSPVFDRYSVSTWIWLGSGLILLVSVLGVLIFLEYRRQLVEIRKLAISLENTVKHNEPMSFRLYGEGEVGLLASSVQELAIRLQETIGQLHRDKDFLKDTVADISHQLKTPLSSLIIYIDLLREGNVDPASAREFLETCRRELDRMEWLTLTLLKLARLEADALPLQIRPARIEDTVGFAYETVRRLADDRGVAIDVEPPSPPSDPVPHDARWLAEAIANLLKNAVEHSPQGGTVTVGWSATPVFLRLYIQDQGPGIEGKHLPHIFRKFYRASKGGSGVGLGLPLAKTIVERHGGMLSVSSEPQGGSRFTLTLPIHPLPAGEFAKAYNTVSEDPVEM